MTFTTKTEEEKLMASSKQVGQGQSWTSIPFQP